MIFVQQLRNDSTLTMSILTSSGQRPPHSAPPAPRSAGPQVAAVAAGAVASDTVSAAIAAARQRRQRVRRRRGVSVIVEVADADADGDDDEADADDTAGDAPDEETEPATTAAAANGGAAAEATAPTLEPGPLGEGASAGAADVEDDVDDGPIRCIFLCEFHATAGPRITAQVPAGRISKELFDTVSRYIIPKLQLQRSFLSV